MMAILAALILCLVNAAPAHAQTVVPFEPANKLTATLRATVTFNAQTQLYTYVYELENAATSQQPIDTIYLETKTKSAIQNAQSPTGWAFLVFYGRPFVKWAVMNGFQPFPEGSPFEGNSPPSTLHVQPGAVQTGFSFRSRFAPTTIRFFARGYRLEPQGLPDDTVIPDFTEMTFQGTTQGPSGGGACPDGDADGDGVCDSIDNCIFTPNSDQADMGTIATSSDPEGATPDGIGDACQCGDVNNDGRVNQTDVDLIRDSALGNTAALAAPQKCNVAGPGTGFPGDCDLDDATDLRRTFSLSVQDLKLRTLCKPAKP